MIALQSILVATDLSEASKAALDYGRELARTFGASLHVLHVTENVAASAAAEYYGPGLHDLQRKIDVAAGQQLDDLLTDEDRHVLQAIPVIRMSIGVAHTIVTYAADAKNDLIVVGTHGRGPITHFFMGSVAEAVVRTAPCPVLAVRSPRNGGLAPSGPE